MLMLTDQLYNPEECESLSPMRPREMHNSNSQFYSIYFDDSSNFDRYDIFPEVTEQLGTSSRDLYDIDVLVKSLNPILGAIDSDDSKENKNSNQQMNENNKIADASGFSDWMEWEYSISTSPATIAKSIFENLEYIPDFFDLSELSNETTELLGPAKEPERIVEVLPGDLQLKKEVLNTPVHTIEWTPDTREVKKKSPCYVDFEENLGEPASGFFHMHLNDLNHSDHSDKILKIEQIENTVDSPSSEEEFHGFEAEAYKKWKPPAKEKRRRGVKAGTRRKVPRYEPMGLNQYIQKYYKILIQWIGDGIKLETIARVCKKHSDDYKMHPVSPKALLRFSRKYWNACVPNEALFERMKQQKVAAAAAKKAAYERNREIYLSSTSIQFSE